MLHDVAFTTILLLGVAVAAGSFVQASVGFGVAIVAAPFIVFAAPDLLPGSLLLCGFALPLTTLLTTERRLNHRALWPALAGRALLTPVGAGVVYFASTQLISLLVGVLVLVGVAASVWAPTLTARPRNTFIAGAITGVSGTAASIGGPFFALTLTREAPATIRSTLAAFFTVGAAVSLTALIVAGEFTSDQLVAGLCWLPFIWVGMAAAKPAAAWLDKGRMRPAVLVFCVVASVAVIINSLK